MHAESLTQPKAGSQGELRVGRAIVPLFEPAAEAAGDAGVEDLPPLPRRARDIRDWPPRCRTLHGPCIALAGGVNLVLSSLSVSMRRQRGEARQPRVAPGWPDVPDFIAAAGLRGVT